MSFKVNSVDRRRCCTYNAKHKTKVFQLLSHHLIEYIHESSKEQLLDFLNNPECLEVIQEYSYEVLEIILMIMNEEHEINKKKINNFCGKVMVFLATHCQANELILFIAEQIELSTAFKPYFHLLFHSLHLCLMRCKNSFKMLDMCIDTITKFLMNLPVPNHEYSQTRNDHIMEETIMSYICIINFIDSIYRDSTSVCNRSKKNTAVGLKNCVFKLIISIFDNNFNYTDISNDICQIVFHKVLNILYFEIDLIYLINLKNDTKIKVSANGMRNEHLKNDYLLKYKHYHPWINMNHVQLSNLCWVIFYSEKKQFCIPSIYNPIYVIFSICQLFNRVMHEKQNQSIITSRLLNLVDFALNLNQLSIPMGCIDSIVHDRFIRNIMNLIISTDSIKVKKYAIDNFTQYINKFEIKAKYRILHKLVISKCHVKIAGIAIVIFKDTVAQSTLDNSEYDDKDKLFFENNFQEFISKICYLKDGANTDLIEMSDQLIPTLNFIIFFIIRQKNSNTAEQLLRASNREFLKSLNDLVRIQVNEWKRYLDHLGDNSSEDQQFFDKLQPSMKTMSVMPKEEQPLMCHQAANTLFIIQNLIERIYELANY